VLTTFSYKVCCWQVVSRAHSQPLGTPTGLLHPRVHNIALSLSLSLSSSLLSHPHTLITLSLFPLCFHLLESTSPLDSIHSSLSAHHNTREALPPLPGLHIWGLSLSKSRLYHHWHSLVGLRTLDSKDSQLSSSLNPLTP
jgi:hypothetical protein